MDCPVCELPMIVVERQGIEIDYCISCHGLWFDSGELRLLAETLGLRLDSSALGVSAALDRGEAVRRCPRCHGSMDKVELGQTRRIVIDRCPQSHGYWFDAQELGALLDQFPSLSSGARPMVSFLGEMFGGGSGTAGP